MNGLAFAIVILPFAAAAATINVNSTRDNTRAGDGRCTLREAIANVNAAADTTAGDCAPGTGVGDTIVFALHPTAVIVLRQGQLRNRMKLIIDSQMVITESHQRDQVTERSDAGRCVV